MEHNIIFLPQHHRADSMTLEERLNLYESQFKDLMAQMNQLREQAIIISNIILELKYLINEEKTKSEKPSNSVPK